jgi:peptidoglycan/xylan/chitin deacetylase (PgdA/CDA1 family)
MRPFASRLAVTLVCLGLLLGACSATPSPSVSPSATPSVAPSVSAGEPTGAADPSATPSLAGSPTPSATASPSGQATIYVVLAGDTIYSIGRRYGTSVEQIVAWNADRYPSLGDDPTTLQPGWELIVAGGPNVTPRPTATVEPTSRPTTAPTTRPTAPPPVASGCRAGNRVAAGNPQTFSRIPGAGRAMAITLDMGGRLDPGVDILKYLIANKVCVTLFPTGAMAQTSAGKEIMAIVRAHPELFEVGNHTMHHCDLVNGGLGSPTTAPCKGGPPSADFIRTELTSAAAIIKDLSGQDPRPYWRPPYGSVNAGVLSAAASVGYTKTLMWDIDTIDWKPISQGGPTAQQIATKVMSRAQDGSIVLDHLGGYETLKALQIMVPGLRERGFTLTTISDLLN